VAKRYVKWNCAEEGTVEANSKALAVPSNLCVSLEDYEAWSDENERLREALKEIAKFDSREGHIAWRALPENERQ
jgi:hypothetical protein